jgi:uncharacterized Zn-binding protein involved in type VI secretion
MKRYTITLGAPTTSGGEVISASANGGINGAIIALENDLIFCPACKSQGGILCIGPRIPEFWNGKQVALENDLCLCGCLPSPRLIASQSLRCQVVEAVSVPKASPRTDLSNADHPNPAKEDEDYNLDFLLTDRATGVPMVDWPYVIELAEGKHLDGRTDSSGRTVKVSARHADHAILRVFAPEPFPINPHWDR